MTYFLGSAVLVASLFGGMASSYAADCGDVSIAEMNWASAGVAAHVDQIILAQGYDCQASLVSGDTMPSFTSMNEKGKPQIIPELWINAVRAPLETAVAEGRLIQVGQILNEGGIQGWYIPKFIADAHPEIKTVQDALKQPALFPAPENPEKSAIYNCPAGWSCQISTQNLYRAIGAEQLNFELVDTGSAAGLDGSISNAFERQRGWLGYYWEPTAIMGKYDMVKLGFGTAYDKTEFTGCTVVADCAAPKVTEYPVSEVYTVVTKDFADKAGVAMDYFKNRNWDNATVNKVLAWMDENQGTNEDGARYFLKTFPDVWTKWVDADTATKIQGSL